MKCKDSNFWIGLGIGSVAGALAYHFSRTEKAKRLEDAICRAIHKASGEAKEFINTTEEEALHVGTKVADKMAHEAHEASEKADNGKFSSYGCLSGTGCTEQVGRQMDNACAGHTESEWNDALFAIYRKP